MSRLEDVDKAFELLLVIIGLVLSIFSSHSEGLINWSSMPPETLSFLLVRITVIPLLIMLLIWMAAKLSANQNQQILIKLVAWMTAISVTIGVLYMYFRELGYIPDARIAGIEYVPYIGYLIDPLLVYFFVVPRYKDMYPDASFFKRKLNFILAYIVFILVQFLGINFLMFGTPLP